MTELKFVCGGKYHTGEDCKHNCIAITDSVAYPPINCLLFVEGYRYTKPKWEKLE